VQSKREGLYTILEAQPGALIIRLTDQGKEELIAYAREDATQHPSVINWTKPHDTILAAMIEDHLGNGWTMPDAAQIGALTSSPILAYDCAFNDEGEITKAEAVYWFPNYQVESELETMLRQGFVRFEQAPEGQPTDPNESYACAECNAQFDNSSAALSHTCKTGAMDQ
jgi:hypothetical protein